MSRSEEVLEEIQKILDIIKDKSQDAKLLLFLHKIDLINQEIRDSEIKSIKTQIQNKLDLPVLFTSIYPNLIYNLYDAFYSILNNFSEATITLKEILDNHIKEYSKIMCYITNKNNNIIVQTMSNDFNAPIINQFHQLITHLTLSFEGISQNKIDHVSISSSNDLKVVVSNLGLLNFDIKNLVLISESLSQMDLIGLIGKISISISMYFEDVSNKRI